MTEKEEKQARYITKLANRIIELQEENIDLNYRIIEILTLREDCPYIAMRYNDSCELMYKKDNNLRRVNNIPIIRKLVEKETLGTTIEDKTQDEKETK